jgi:hypothetical protein
MKLGASDLKRLGLPIAACVALALAGVACYLAADNYLRDAKELGAAMTAQRAEVQTRLARANEEEREITANLQQYQALAARGIVGEEKRLDWIDAITAIKNERQLFNIGYSIEPQKELDYPGFAPGGGVNFVFSRVKIELQLLHEEDLLNFIDDLAKRGRSYLSVRSCDVQRTERRSGGTTLDPRLQAACVFDLITINHNKPAQAPGGG